jgi:hypothetical protein
MAFDFDSASETTGTANPTTYTHTPVAAPGGIVIHINHPGATDIVTGLVTYGGVACSRIATAADTSAVPERSYAYFLGESVPSGPQTVSIGRSEATTTIHVVVIAVTADVDTEVIDTDSASGSITNPSVTLTNGDGRLALATVGMASSINVILGGGADFTGQQRVHDNSFGGTDTSLVSRQTTPGTTDFAVGYTMNAGHVAIIGLLVAETTAPDTPAPSDVSNSGNAVFRSPQTLAAQIRGAQDISQLKRVLGTELPKIAQFASTYERVAPVPYGTTVRPPGDLSRTVLVTVTDTVAFTVAPPERPREGVHLTIDFFNNSGGTMGTVTFDPAYQLTAAFVAPANGAHKVYSFYRTLDKAWREVARSGASGTGGTVGAPDDAQYIVSAAHASLTAERVATDNTQITWDFTTAAQAKANIAALTQ